MIVVMQPGADEARVEAVIARLNAFGFDVHRSSGAARVVIGAIGVHPGFDVREMRTMEGVADAYRVTEPYRLASRAWRAENTVIDVGGVPVGGTGVVVIAGPGVVEGEAQIEAVAAHVAASGGGLLRGGAVASASRWAKGMDVERLRQLASAGRRHGLPVVAEVLEAELVDTVREYADLLQVGARNMQNFALLEAVARADRPVLLKRGHAATVDEWLVSAEYLLEAGNPHVILCERGIRTFETYTRNTLDLSAVPVVKKKSHLPILVDPSAGTGIRGKVLPMARAAVAAGADGLMVEVHPDPLQAERDGPQSLDFPGFAELMEQVPLIARAIGRTMATQHGVAS